jgi:hypothetical protein
VRLDLEGTVAGMGSSAKILLCLCVIVGGTETARARFLDLKRGGTPPRGRIACYASSTVGTRYPDPLHLGPHSYGFNLRERNGIVYTCRGGHIDITHLRKAADWTAYIAFRIRRALLSGDTRLSYRMREPSLYFIEFTYPNGWAALPTEARERIAAEIAVPAAQYCAFAGMVWHEVITWFGYKSIGIYTEYPSAFSWEDVYSNSVGCRLAGEALRDPGRSFDEAMTALLDRELQRLGVQPKRVAWQAGEAVRGEWFVNDFLLCDLVKRNFDIGLDDGFVTPWLVPGIGGCPDETPVLYPVPDLSVLHEHEFSMKLEIEPKEWERKEFAQFMYPSGRIEPARDYEPLMEYIRAQAIRRYGLYVDDHSLPSLATPPAVTPVQGEGVAAASPVLTGAQLGMQPADARRESRPGSYHARAEDAGSRPGIADLLTFAYFWLGEEP